MAQKAGQIATNDRFADASAFLRTFSFIPRVGVPSNLDPKAKDGATRQTVA